MAKPINKKLLSLLIAIPAVFTVLTVFSLRQPFIFSQAYYDSLKFIVFPVSTIGLWIFVSLKRYKSTGMTGLQMRLKDAKSTFDKVKMVAQMMLAIPAFLALIIWLTSSYIVWPLKLFSGQPITLDAQLVESVPLRRTMNGLTKLTISIEHSLTTNTLRWPSKSAQHFHEGEQLIIAGNQTWFGITANRVDKRGN